MLAYLERLLKKPVQYLSRCPGLSRDLICAFDLSEDLRLTDDHGFQTRSHPKQMPNGGGSRQSKKMLELRCLYRTVEIMKKRFDSYLRIRADNVEFRSVTGRQEYTFVDTTDLPEPHQRIGQCRVRDSKTLPDFDVRRMMTDAETENIHLKRWTIRDESNPPKRTQQQTKCDTRQRPNPLPRPALPNSAHYNTTPNTPHTHK